MSDEMTLDQARRMVAENECMSHGHDFEHIVKFGGDPIYVLCGRCGKVWEVTSVGHDAARVKP